MRVTQETSIPARRHRGRRVVWWLAAIALVVTLVWAGWREYEYRAAIQEAQGLGWTWASMEPFDAIRKSWRAAFRRSTWAREAELTITSRDPTAHAALIGRLNPTEVVVQEVNDLEPLQGLPRLRRLTIRRTQTLTDLNALRNLPGLERLDVHGCPELREVGGSLSSLKKLRVLSFTGCPVLRSLEGLHDLPELGSLSVSGSNELETTSGLSGLPELAELQIVTCSYLKNLDGLARLGKLANVSLIDCPGLSNVDGLRGGPVRKLFLSSSWVADFEGLRGLSELEVLTLENCPALKDLGVIAESTRLRWLMLGNDPKLENFEVLKKLPALAEVHIVNCPKFSEEVRSEIGRARPELQIPKSQGIMKTLE
jgi:hypothetical protein